MLLRSSSAPILDSWPNHSKDSTSSSSESEPALIRTRSVSYSSSFLSPLLNDDPIKKAHSALSEVDFHIPPMPKKKSSISHCHFKQPTLKIKDCCEEEQQKKLRVDSKSSSSSSLSSSTLERLFSSSGLGQKDMDLEEYCAVGKIEEALLALDVDGGAGGEGGRRKGRRGLEGADNGGSGFFDSNNHGNDNYTDAYYQNMIDANPGNPLLLGNYAKFLKEVRKDYAKAEEYCERAILTNPNDGNILSLYADLVWTIHKDATRAEKYFEQAVKASPDDCYIQASYAQFLWDAEDDEEEEEDQHKREHGHTNPAPFLYGASYRQPITAKQQHRRLIA